MNWIVIFLITIIFNLVACHHFDKKEKNINLIRKNNSEKKVMTSFRSFPKTKETEFDKNISKLNGKRLLSSISEEKTKPKPIELTDKEKVFFELIGEKLDNLTEIYSYQKVVEKYQKNDEEALNAYANVLLKKYPRSIYCDNALYLQGMLYFSQKKFGESLVSFQKILNLFPQSNKAVSALFAKGVVFKKMNLNKQSLQLLAQVINRYPGSPESARAEVEVKLMTQ